MALAARTAASHCTARIPRVHGCGAAAIRPRNIARAASTCKAVCSPLADTAPGGFARVLWPSTCIHSTGCATAMCHASQLVQCHSCRIRNTAFNHQCARSRTCCVASAGNSADGAAAAEQAAYSGGSRTSIVRCASFSCGAAIASVSFVAARPLLAAMASATAFAASAPAGAAATQRTRDPQKPSSGGSTSNSRPSDVVTTCSAAWLRSQADVSRRCACTLLLRDTSKPKPAEYD